MDAATIKFIAEEAGLFVVGAVLGAISFSTIALPLLYALPRAVLWSLQGRLRWRVVPRRLLKPLVWCALFAGAAYLLARYAPGAWVRLYTSPVFYVGLWAGISVRAFRKLGTKAGQRKLRDDFLDSVISHFKQKEHAREEEMGEDVYQPIWHMLRGGVRYGPFSYEDLRRRAARGEVRETDLLWRPGVSEWAEAGSILGPMKKSKR